MIFTGASTRGYHYYADFMLCEQLGGYRHIMHLRPLREKPERAIGTVAHLGIAALYAGEADPIGVIEAAPRRLLPGLDLGRQIVDAYMGRHAALPAAQRPVVLAVETEFKAIADGALVTFRGDRVEARNGKAFNIDVKTWGPPPIANNIRAEFEMDGQIITQHMIARAAFPATFGVPYGGTIIEAIPKSFPFEPVQVAMPSATLDRLVGPHRESLIATAKRIEAVRAEVAAGKDPMTLRRNHTACKTRWGPCEFRAICLRAESALDDFQVVIDDATSVEA